MALRFCLLALSVIFAASSGVLASDSQQCRSMLIGYPGWTTNVTQNDLSMMSMLSQVAMDQTYPPGPPGPPIGPGGPMPRMMDEMHPPGGPMGPIGPMAQRSCTFCEKSWGPFPWGAYGVCEGGTRTCTTCRIVIIDGKQSQFCEIVSEPCGHCETTTTTGSW
jgi:hypothetical protein